MNVNKIADNIYEIPPKTLMARTKGIIEKFEMRVPVKIYANEQILEKIRLDRTIDQICNLCIKNYNNFGLSAGIFVHT